MWKNISSFVTSFVNETLENESTPNSSAASTSTSSSETESKSLIDGENIQTQKTDGKHRNEHDNVSHENKQITEHSDAATPQSISSSSVEAEQLANEPAKVLNTQISASPYQSTNDSHTHAQSHRPPDTDLQHIKNESDDAASASASSDKEKDAPEESLSASLFSFLSSASQSLQLNDDKTATAQSLPPLQASANTNTASASASSDSSVAVSAVDMSDAIPPLSESDRAILRATSADADSTFLSRRQALQFTQRIASSASSFLSNLKNQTMSVLATSKNDQQDENGEPRSFQGGGPNEEEIAQLIEALHFQDKQNKLVIKEYNKIIHENESSARQQIGERDAEIRFLRNELSENQKKLSTLEVSTKALQGSADGNERNAKDSAALLADKTEQIRALLQVNRDLYAKYSTISSEKPFDPASHLDEKQLQQEIQTAMKQNELDSSQNASSAAVANLNSLIVRLAHALEESTKTIHQRDEQVSELLASNFSSHQAKYESQLQTANQNFLSLQSEFENESKSWRNKENELKLSEKKLQSSLQSMRNEMEKNEKLLENREQLLSQKDEQVFTLEKQLLDKDQQRKLVQESLNTAQTQISALKESLQTLQTKVDNGAAVQMHLTAATDDIKRLEEAIGQLKAENDQLKEQSGNNAINAAKESELQTVIDRQKRLLASQTEELAALQKRDEQLRSESEQQKKLFSNQTAQLHTDLKAAQTALSDSAAKEKKRFDDSNTAQQQLSAELSLLKKTVQQKESECKEWKDKYDKLASSAKPTSLPSSTPRTAATPSASASFSSSSSASASSSSVSADPWSAVDAGNKSAPDKSASAPKADDDLDELDELIASFESK